VGEVVGDVVAANRMQKTGSGDRETRRIGCAGWLSGVELLISYSGYSIDLLYIYIYTHKDQLWKFVEALKIS